MGGRFCVRLSDSGPGPGTTQPGTRDLAAKRAVGGLPSLHLILSEFDGRLPPEDIKHDSYAERSSLDDPAGETFERSADDRHLIRFVIEGSEWGHKHIVPKGGITPSGIP